jgi:hypothetical protein
MKSEVAGFEELCGNRFPTWHSINGLRSSDRSYSVTSGIEDMAKHARDYIIKKS